MRVQAEQQRELDTLRDALRDERCKAYAATHTAKLRSQEAAEATEQRDRLQSELEAERTERMESESAALEREEALQAKIDELEEKERRRIELEEALAAAEPAPSGPVASIAVSTAPVEAPKEGFDAMAGGFSL